VHVLVRDWKHVSPIATLQDKVRFTLTVEVNAPHLFYRSASSSFVYNVRPCPQ
jgi:hypothetical protein